jgi:hypothetical protein
MKFRWDSEKAAANLRDHKVSFEEATRVFLDPNLKEWYDEDHSTLDEPRFNAVGMSSRRLLFVAFTEEEGDTRIISARKAKSRERKAYEKKK